MNAPSKIILLREGGLVASLVSDTYTFGIIVGSVWFNHQFIGGSYFLNAILLVMFVLLLIAKGSTKRHIFYSIAELEEYLTKAEGRS